jgi:hypothetical protein
MSADQDPMELMEKAIRDALASRAGNMIAIARRYYPDITATGNLKVCPFCEKSGNTFSVSRAKSGGWTWGCTLDDCRANNEYLAGAGMADTIGLIAMNTDGNRRKAAFKLLEFAAIPVPEGVEEEEEFPTTESTESTEEEGETPAKTKKKKSGKAKAEKQEDEDSEEQGEEPPPDAPKLQIWNRMHQLLTLSPQDVVKLGKERGFSKETIKEAGFKSSNRKNRELLAPLLVEFPPGILLSTGIANKADDGSLKISGQLCGWGLKKRGEASKDEEWDWTEPVLIPYRDAAGDITVIRPHKGGLSGKNYMREHGFELGFRSARTRSQLYTNTIFYNRPEGWERTAVLTEGEFKGEALGQCNIPAAATPGIQMPRNDAFFEAMVERFREAGIRDIIVCYDNEDKSHKADPWKRHDAEVYALYVCHALRAKGFHTSHLTLPNEWRDESGKADWDGALARFGSGAAAKFRAALKRAKPYFPQAELFAASEEERIIHCKLTRLIYNPQIPSGGDSEQELARLIRRTPGEWRKPRPYVLNKKAIFLPGIPANEIANELDETKGCYFKAKKPTEEILPKWFIILGLIRDEIRQCPHEDLEKMAGLEAALAAVNHIIEGRPEILTDFTITCDYQVRTQGGEIHRLFLFKNKHGQTSEHITVPPAAVSTSTKFREFCMGVGNFNPKIGDKQLQELMQDIGTFSAWREIRELEMLGRDPESNLWIFGDCAITKEGTVLFADDHDIIWHDGIGYRIDPQDLEGFVHKTPPKFFKKLGMTPQECYKEITATPEAIAHENRQVARIWFQQVADMIASFGGMTGMLSVGNLLSYAAAPELLRKYNAHPGQWIHGRMSAGKTEMARFQMMTWGFDAEYRTQVSGGGTTAVSIDRFLAQYSDIPVNIDEFREKEADATRNGTLRACFNRQGKTKGRMDQTNRTRSVQPRTAPIVTGEGVTTDSATLSRYVDLVLSKDRRLGTPEQQQKRYQRMCNDQFQYHRIVRHILMDRAAFAAELMVNLEEFLSDKAVIQGIAQDRLRLVYGIAWAAFTTMYKRMMPILSSAPYPEEEAIIKNDLIMIKDHIGTFREDTITYATNANSDVASINFVIKFWQNVCVALEGHNSMKKFIRFERCEIDPDNRVKMLATKRDVDGSVRCVIVRAGELYAEYEKEMGQRRVTPDLSLEGIRGEIRRENYWVPAPATLKNKAHRLSWDDDGQKSCWVLRFDRMEPPLQQVFSDHFNEEEQEELRI